MRFLVALICGFVGGFVGYLGGLFIAHAVWPDSNLIGLVGLFITGPIGFVAGSMIYLRLSEGTRTSVPR